MMISFTEGIAFEVSHFHVENTSALSGYLFDDVLLWTMSHDYCSMYVAEYCTPNTKVSMSMLNFMHVC